MISRPKGEKVSSLYILADTGIVAEHGFLSPDSLLNQTLTAQCGGHLRVAHAHSARTFAKCTQPPAASECLFVIG